MKVSKRGIACLSMLLILASIILYLALVLPILYRPLIGDDTLNAIAFRAPVGTPFDTWGHPPLYADISRTLVHFTGTGDENLRIFGIICFLVTIYLINLVAGEVSRDKRVGLMAGILYAIHPLAIQGSLVLDIDNTILTVILMVSVLYFLKTYESPRLKNILFLGLLFFLGLWAKLSTPILLTISIFIFYIFSGKVKRGITHISVIGGLGAGLFLLLWFFYSSAHNLSFFGVFTRSLWVLSRAQSGPTFSGFKELGLRITRIYLWLGPYFTILWAIIVILRIKNYFAGKDLLKGVDFLILYSLVIFLSYVIVGGGSLGFAKYHYPVVSIMCILIAEFISGMRPFRNKKIFIFCLILGLIFVILEWTMVGDLLYEVNYTLRKLAVFMPERLNNFFLNFINHLLFYHLALIAGFILLYFANTKKDIIKNLSLFLLSLILISNLSLDIRQARVGYFTTLCYGRSISEFRQLVGLVKEIHRNNPSAIIIAPEDIMLKAVGQWYAGYTYDIFRNNRQKFLEAIKEDKVYCVVYAFTWNAVYTFKEVFFHPAVRKVLEEKYRIYPLGEYSIYLKKK